MRYIKFLAPTRSSRSHSVCVCVSVRPSVQSLSTLLALSYLVILSEHKILRLVD